MDGEDIATTSYEIIAADNSVATCVLHPKARLAALARHPSHNVTRPALLGGKRQRVAGDRPYWGGLRGSSDIHPVHACDERPHVLAYGPNGGQSNLSFFRNAEYDELLKQSRRVRTDAERNKLYARMTEIVAAYAPMGGGIYRIENTIAKPWIVGYKKDSFRSQPWRFVDVDLARMKAAQ